MAPSQKKRRLSISASQITKYQQPASKLQIKQLAKLLGVESHYLDTYNTSVDIGSASWTTPECLNLVGVGDLPTERTGKKYRITSLQVKGTFSSNGQTDLDDPPYNPVMRAVIFQDKQVNGAIPTATDVFEPGSGTYVNCLRNPEYEHRFKVLMDKRITLPLIIAQDSASTCSVKVGADHWEFYTKLDIEVMTQDGDADIAAIVDNGLFIMFCCQTAVSDPRTAFSARIRFVG